MSAAAAPGALAEALGLLAADRETLPIAGCTDLMVADALERDARRKVLDLLAFPELRGVWEVAGGVEIGATTTFSEVARHPVLQERFPALVAAARSVGGWQIQNRATLGGNVANASPAGDSLPVLLVLDAVVVAASAAGEREIPYQEFHVAYRRTALRPGEIVARLRLPWPPPGSRQGFRKVGTRAAQAISKVAVALVGGTADGVVTLLRLGAASVAATPVRLRGAESAALELPLAVAAEAAAGAAAAEVAPIDDVRSTAAYRRFALARVVRRLVLELEETR